MENSLQKTKNYKFQNQFPNNNQNSHVTPINRIKSLYTTIIKSSKSNNNKNNEIKYIEKSTSRAKRENNLNNNNKELIFSFEEDEKKNFFNKTTYIKTDEYEKSPIHVKYIYTVSNNETPKSNNKILNVKIQERKSFNLRSNIDLRYSTSVNNQKNKKINIINSSEKNKSKKNKSINKNKILSKSINKKTNESSLKNIFNSCINFDNRRKNEKITTQKSLSKSKQKIIKKLPNYKKRHSDLKSYSLNHNQKIIQNKTKHNLNSSSKKNINKVSSNNTSNTSVNNLNNNNTNSNIKNQNLKKVDFNKTISSNLHHYNYTTLSTRIKSSISTLSSTNSSNSLNKYYKCPIVPFSIIKQKIFNNTSNQKNNKNNVNNIINNNKSEINNENNNTTNKINNNNNNSNIKNNNTNSNFNINNSNNINNNNIKNNKLSNYNFTESNNAKNTKKLINYSVITITIISNWGNKDKVGITEIQLFDSKDRKIPISECHVFNGNEEHIGRIHNNKYHTLNDRDMWTCDYKIKNNKFIKIEIYILSNIYMPNDNIKSIIIWNYNGRELNKGIKEVEICKRNNKCWKGIIPKGEYNIKSDYSFKINLYENETLSLTLTNNKSYKRNLYLSLLKQSQISHNSNLSKSDNNNNNDNNFENIINNNYDNNYNNSNFLDFKSERIDEKLYIKFKKIRIKFLSNYGHFYFIGITGLNLIDKDNKIIDIEKEAFSIGALPKDLRTIYNNNEDNRVFENAFNNINNTIDENEMWLTIKNPKPYIEIIFKKEMTLNKINFWNYNEPFSLDKGVKEIEITINDDKIYKTYLWKGLGIDFYDYYQSVSLIDLEKKKNKRNVVDFNIKKYPIGFVFKIVLIDNFGDKDFICLENIEFFDKNNINLRDEIKNTVISQTNNINLIYSHQLYDYKKDEFSRCFNFFFICFEEFVQVKYIKINNKNSYLSQNLKNIQIYCDDVLYFEGKIKQTGESIISFEDDYNKLNNNIKKSNIICLNSINSKEQNMYQEIINNGIYMLVLEKDE